MFLIFMNPRNGEVVFAKRSNLDPVSRSRETTRNQIQSLYPTREVLSPLGRVPSGNSPDNILLLTVYKSRNKSGEGRTCGTFETWAVLPEAKETRS